MTQTKTDLREYTKTELIELLTTDIAGWNKLYQEALEASDYLRYADLRSADLRYEDLRSANLGSANLRSADLRYANLGSANLRYADLRYANLRYADLGSADLGSADLRYADLRYADLGYADLRSADLRSADLWSANLDGGPITVTQWCDLIDLAHCGQVMRVAYKRLPKNRETGADYNDGKHIIKWVQGRFVECADWSDTAECGGGLHLSPSPVDARTYSGESLCVPVAFDPADAVLLDGNKLKVRKCKVLG